jgi:hypothetical protein
MVWCWLGGHDINALYRFVVSSSLPIAPGRREELTMARERAFLVVVRRDSATEIVYENKRRRESFRDDLQWGMFVVLPAEDEMDALSAEVKSCDVVKMVLMCVDASSRWGTYRYLVHAANACDL